jgi:hypothetical protein
MTHQNGRIFDPENNDGNHFDLWPFLDLQNEVKGHQRSTLSFWRYYMFFGTGITINDIILTSDLSVTFKSRSKVNFEFFTLLYVFWDGDHDKQHHFDLWPFLDLQIEVTFVKSQIWVLFNVKRLDVNYWLLTIDVTDNYYYYYYNY